VTKKIKTIAILNDEKWTSRLQTAYTNLHMQVQDKGLQKIFFNQQGILVLLRKTK
jgi:hypothetical protein